MRPSASAGPAARPCSGSSTGLPGFVSVAVGAFADPGFMAPKVSIYEVRRHAWALAADLDIEHID